MRLLLVLTCVVIACMGSSAGRRSAGTPRSLPDTCSAESLGRVFATDTSHLQRVRREGPSAGSTEGMALTVYYLDRSPKVIAVEYLGETGAVSTTYFLRTAQDFVADREQLEYSQPVSMGEPVIISRLREITYFCGGKPLVTRYARVASEMKNRLDSLMASRSLESR